MIVTYINTYCNDNFKRLFTLLSTPNRRSGHRVFREERSLNGKSNQKGSRTNPQAPRPAVRLGRHTGGQRLPARARLARGIGGYRDGTLRLANSSPHG